MVIERDLVAIAPVLSVTPIVKIDVLALVGVPLITPVVVFRAKPVGRLPEVIDQVYGITPLSAASVWLYATPISPLASDAVVMTTVELELTVINKAFVAAKWWATGQTPQILVVKIGISSALRPTQNFSKPLSSGIFR
jgi:hypothetical protein